MEYSLRGGYDLDPYERFCQDVERCLACPLAKTRKQVVICRGNHEAELAFIGEAPGQHEDEDGLAFVGRAGKLLDDMCYVLNLDVEEDAYFLNILKCRPPDNEFPKPGVVKQCLPFLDRQLDLVKPKVVILTGAQAARYTVWRSYPGVPKMEDLRGRWIWSQRYPTIDFLAMYHPAYLLRLEGDDPAAYDQERERSLDIIEWGLDLLDGKKPPVEPLIVGSQVLIERARNRERDARGRQHE